MKILHVADLHLNHDWFDWVASQSGKCDLLVIAGDLQNAFSNVSMHDQSRACIRWLLSLTTPTIICSGNHDHWVGDPQRDRDAEAKWLKSLRAKPVRRDLTDPRNFLRSPGAISGVDDDLVEIGGLKICVNGWLQVPDLHDHVDILVTHAPPMGCACASGNEGRDNGDPELFPAVQYIPPTLILAGHIHTPVKYACTWPSIDPTTLVLVPGCNEEAETPNNWLIDTSDCTARHNSGELVHWT